MEAKFNKEVAVAVINLIGSLPKDILDISNQLFVNRELFFGFLNDEKNLAKFIKISTFRIQLAVLELQVIELLKNVETAKILCTLSELPVTKTAKDDVMLLNETAGK